MSAIKEIYPSTQFHIFTTVPRWFFRDSVAGEFVYHSVLTDIGLVQRTPLREDIGATIARLRQFIPFDRALLNRLAKQLTRLGCELVVCDISPFGIATAMNAGIPSVLVENFTWDWIYEGYARKRPVLKPFIAYLNLVFRAADYHIQTEPICRLQAVDLTTAPISRAPRQSRKETREQLGIPLRAKAVVVTMGGVQGDYKFLERLREQTGVYFVIPGVSTRAGKHDNLVLLPHRSRFFHPDLVNGCDAVIGKAGYSTVAEVYHAGIPFGYVSRPLFRESEVLEEYVRKEMRGIEIADAEFERGNWVRRLDELLSLPRVRRRARNGAKQAARFIQDLTGF